jgi:hypothetical protein
MARAATLPPSAKSGSLLMAQPGHADPAAQCPLSGEERKTSARSEYFRVGPGADLLTSNCTKPRRIRRGFAAGVSLTNQPMFVGPLGITGVATSPRVLQADAYVVALGSLTRWISPRNLSRAEIRARRACWRLRTGSRRVQDRTAVRSEFPDPTRCAGRD